MVQGVDNRLDLAAVAESSSPAGTLLALALALAEALAVTEAALALTVTLLTAHRAEKP